jgi:hypothetical protein
MTDNILDWLRCMNALDYFTAFLALATAALAYETRRMAAATKKMIDLTAAPYTWRCSELIFNQLRN